jgi:NAD(P)-dependent dehydrogenase (short-subunit alcohol dehydrogenase family)
MLFQDKVVVVTGGAQGIGKCCAECFEREGATVHVIDIQQGPWFVGDLANKADLERFAAEVIAKSGHVDIIVRQTTHTAHGPRFRQPADLVRENRNSYHCQCCARSFRNTTSS